MRTPAQTNNPLFDRFWQAYPRKEGKPDALRTFEKLITDKEIFECVMNEFNRQYREKDWKNTAKKYIPMAQTWLNRRDWEENQNGSDQERDTRDTEIGCCTVLR